MKGAFLYQLLNSLSELSVGQFKVGEGPDDIDNLFVLILLFFFFQIFESVVELDDARGLCLFISIWEVLESKKRVEILLNCWNAHRVEFFDLVHNLVEGFGFLLALKVTVDSVFDVLDFNQFA